MCSQSAYASGCKVTLVAFVWLFQWWMAASARAGGEINEYRFDREHGLLVRPFRHPSFVISCLFLDHHQFPQIFSPSVWHPATSVGAWGCSYGVWSVHLGYYLSVNPTVSQITQFWELCKIGLQLGHSKAHWFSEIFLKVLISIVEYEGHQFGGLVVLQE